MQMTHVGRKLFCCFQSSQAYSSPVLSIIRTVMMMFELDYMVSFNEPYTDGNDTTLHFGNLSLFMLLAFVLLMPILLMNLLVSAKDY